MAYTIYKKIRHGKYEPYIYAGGEEEAIKHIRLNKLKATRDDAHMTINLSDNTYIIYDVKGKPQIARQLIRLMRIPK